MIGRGAAAALRMSSSWPPASSQRLANSAYPIYAALLWRDWHDRANAPKFGSTRSPCADASRSRSPMDSMYCFAESRKTRLSEAPDVTGGEAHAPLWVRRSSPAFSLNKRASNVSQSLVTGFCTGSAIRAFSVSKDRGEQIELWISDVPGFIIANGFEEALKGVAQS